MRCITVMYLTVAMLFASAMLAVASTDSIEPYEYCEKDLGSKTPVLLIHGFNSSKGMWDDVQIHSKVSMRKALDSIEDAVVVEPFDYSNEAADEWIDHPNVGPKFAQQIDCLARSSKKSGGNGKVIIVAHSMGGLVTRYAAGLQVGGREVHRSIGLLITMGTPHKGSIVPNYARFADDNLARVFGGVNGKRLVADSPELSRLKALDKSIPVRALVGNIAYTSLYNPAFTLDFITIKEWSGNDGIVPVESALDVYTDKYDYDGKAIYRCETDDKNKRPYHVPPEASCAHTSMAASAKFQQDVKDSIEIYIDSHPMEFADGLAGDDTKIVKIGRVKLQVPESYGVSYLYTEDSEWISFETANGGVFTITDFAPTPERAVPMEVGEVMVDESCSKKITKPNGMLVLLSRKVKREAVKHTCGDTATVNYRWILDGSSEESPYDFVTFEYHGKAKYGLPRSVQDSIFSTVWR